MQRIRKLIKPDLADLAAPLCVVFPTLVNVLFYYLGLAYMENPARSYGFIILNVLFAVACGVLFLISLREFHFPAITWILLGAVPVLFAIWFLLGLTRYGLHPSVVEYLEQFIVFCLPALLCGILMAFRRSDASFFEKLDSISFLALPAGIIYLNGLAFQSFPNAPSWGYSLGIIGYMPLAYFFMPFFFAHVICFIEKLPLVLPFSHKPLAHGQIIRFCMLTVYWLAIIGSGTRGTYFCVLGFIILVFLLKIVRRESVWQPLKVILPLVLIFLFLLFIYTPPHLTASTGSTFSSAACKMA